MHHKFIALIVLSSFGVVPAQNTSPRQTTTLLVRIGEAQLSMHPTAGPNYVANCLVVAPDGRARLELRRQEFLNGRATRATYEGTLNAKELDFLRGILQGDAIRTLPRLIKPTLPLSVDSFSTVTAKVYGPLDMQEIGYFEWQGKAPENAASAGEDWSRAATAMKPLVEWFHSLKSMFAWRSVSNPKKEICDEP